MLFYVKKDIILFIIYNMKYYDLVEIINDSEIKNSYIKIFNFIFNKQNIKITKPFIKNQFFSEVYSSNTIEGVLVDNPKKLFSKKDGIKKDNEREWIGLKIAYKKIINDPSIRILSVFNLKKIHKILINSEKDYAGKLKKEENFINQKDKDGFIVKAITTSSPKNTKKDLEEAINKYYLNLKKYPEYSLVIIILFIAEFLAIHPFWDGNGRISRLIMISLCLENNLDFVKNVSLTKFIKENKEEYYSSLDFQTKGFQNDFKIKYIKPFINYYFYIFYKSHELIDNFNSLETLLWKEILTLKSFKKSNLKTAMSSNYKSKILHKFVKEKRILKNGYYYIINKK